jgi:L-amino acid N-acyltransferase YncA
LGPAQRPRDRLQAASTRPRLFRPAVDGTPVIVLSSLITDARELKGACLHAAGDAAAATRTRVGFTSVGMYRRHGKFDGEWRDCMIVEKIMGEAAEA